MKTSPFFFNMLSEGENRKMLAQPRNPMNRMASPLIGVRGGALSDYTIRGSGFFVRPGPGNQGIRSTCR